MQQQTIRKSHVTASIVIASLRAVPLECNQQAHYVIAPVQPRLIVQCASNLVLKILGELLRILEVISSEADHTS